MIIIDGSNDVVKKKVKKMSQKNIQQDQQKKMTMEDSSVDVLQSNTAVTLAGN